MTAEAGGVTAHALVFVTVQDVNDNPPHFIGTPPEVTIIEEDDRDLPLTLTKVSDKLSKKFLLNFLLR